MSKNYFEITYQGPYKGVFTELPEDIIGPDASPFINNFTLKHGELRPRPRQVLLIPGTIDQQSILACKSFTDQNNVFHTVAITSGGLYQLNQNWNLGNNKLKLDRVWSKIGAFLVQPGPNLIANTAVFIDKLFWTNGGNHLWMRDLS